jgi:hypothetical protein
MSRIYTTEIYDNEYIGDSLATININYANLDTGLSSVSAENILLKDRYNTLIQNLSGIGAPGTDYTSLSTSFLSLSALIIP